MNFRIIVGLFVLALMLTSQYAHASERETGEDLVKQSFGSGGWAKLHDRLFLIVNSVESTTAVIRRHGSSVDQAVPVILVGSGKSIGSEVVKIAQRYSRKIARLHTKSVFQNGELWALIDLCTRISSESATSSGSVFVSLQGLDKGEEWAAKLVSYSPSNSGRTNIDTQGVLVLSDGMTVEFRLNIDSSVRVEEAIGKLVTEINAVRSMSKEIVHASAGPRCIAVAWRDSFSADEDLSILIRTTLARDHFNGNTSMVPLTLYFNAENSDESLAATRNLGFSHRPDEIVQFTDALAGFSQPVATPDPRVVYIDPLLRIERFFH